MKAEPAGFSMSPARCTELMRSAAEKKIRVVGDIVLDQFIWGRVRRISPEAPVPIVDLEKESFMPGGAANVAYNLCKLGVGVKLFGAIGRDEPGRRLSRLLKAEGVDVRGLIACRTRPTSVKMRIVSGQQQITRLDRETIGELDGYDAVLFYRRLKAAIAGVDAVVVGDYGKGVVTQRLIDELRRACSRRRIWLSLDPKPSRPLSISGMSLLTPNRREAFQLAGIVDSKRSLNPLQDEQLMAVSKKLIADLKPSVLLITLSELGMLLCAKGQEPIHAPTVAREVFDVSGAGDSVIASFTLAIVAGASPLEAAVLSNHAAGVVVGKVGTATITKRELLHSLRLEK